MGYETKIILDSVTPAGARLTTFQLTLPRIVLAEFNTHKMVSKNSASSRAIPVPKKIARIEADPFIPRSFVKNRGGMQATEDLDAEVGEKARAIWVAAKDAAINFARGLAGIEVHKMLANRIIEAYDWHTIVATATEWSNYFALRDHVMAQPEIRDSAHAARELYERNEPTLVPAGEWHLPYVTGYDVGAFAFAWKEEDLVAMSAGRCAAVSYLDQENQLDPVGDVKRAWERLIPAGHMSPTEHPAMSLTRSQWQALARAQANEWIERRIPVGNFWGWRQWRKTIENEHDFALLKKGRGA